MTAFRNVTQGSSIVQVTVEYICCIKSKTNITKNHIINVLYQLKSENRTDHMDVNVVSYHSRVLYNS